MDSIIRPAIDKRRKKERHPMEPRSKGHELSKNKQCNNKKMAWAFKKR